MKLSFSTKARTLGSLKHVLKSARIAPIRTFTVSDWNSKRQACLNSITTGFGNGPWIVRSSCSREDSNVESNAGRFLSVQDVDKKGLIEAIEQVILSYDKAEATDEILIQPMLDKTIRSGVGFSHDPNTCAPYRVVNWLDGSDTAAVTGGTGGQMWQQAANLPSSAKQPGPILAPIFTLLEELLLLFDGTPLDFEFAVTREAEGDVLWLLQVRQLVLPKVPEPEATQTERLERIQQKLMKGMQPHPFLMGQRTVYGVMPDWNPAEIIGIRPKPLALSLYRDLITDSIWAYQRHNYGYRNLRSFPLMQHFFGLPYIDVRLSFNSFIPADLDSELAGRLVDYYVDLLLAKPALHDKVEFEIVFSCYTMDLPLRLKRLNRAGFSKQDCTTLSHSLRKLTNRIIQPEVGLWRADAAKIDVLNERRKQLLNSCDEPIEKIYWLLEDAKRYGTLPFAGLARAGFIAVQMLRSLVKVGIFTQDDYNAFLSGVSTVSGQLAQDRTSLDKTAFLKRYGHLRPGTYDILTPRYDEAPELYFDWSGKPEDPNRYKTPAFSEEKGQLRKIEKLLKEHGLHAEPEGLIDFMKAGIELREAAKFHFTQNLSDALSIITQYGHHHGFCREDLAYCEISAFRELHLSASNARNVLSNSIEQGKERYSETSKISLPPLITKPEDVWAFEWPDASPNFITQKQVTAPVMGINSGGPLTGAIICVPSADPGFDWLFSHSIRGLITIWGGANSHMAIRAGELELPAVIGAGEALFTKCSNAQRLHLDCAGRRVEVVA